MGTFYGNVLVARTCSEVVPLLDGGTGAAGVPGSGGEAIRGYAMAVGPRHTVICPDEGTDVVRLAGPLSRLLGAPTLSAYVYDSDVLDMRVFQDGELRHCYDSFPGYFDEVETDEDGNPVGGADGAYPEPVGADPEPFLPLAAGPVDRAMLGSVLRRTPLDPEDGEGGRYVFADDQHYDVVSLLGLDTARLTTGYEYMSRGHLPAGTQLGDLIMLGGARPPAPSGD
ncbi:hypothetical protein ADK57_15050 [Streptomyces sp. MMG1533]|uniref:hypothetical protein n=1 Tax=Streptomyces sp. MMG1533 TaxID=1415546 RepID=UPI0006ADA81F|nr:hypothetical protein [Streptomyces sp. MMG1533]KOU68921.1 hypothetical protein ADK57_15050 [Streptomyces sp. MMG1533]